MKKLVALLLTLCMVLSVMVFASAETLTGSAQGFGSEVKVELTVEDGKIVDLKVKDSGESYPVPRKDSVGKVIAAIIEANGTEGVDVNTGATFTCAAVVEAVNKALAEGSEAVPAGDITFTPGEYEATAYGYNGNVTAKVTFSDTALTAVEILSSVETAHVGNIAFDIMIPEMIKANGSGVDVVSGATFSSRALKSVVNDAAEQAGCTNLDAFKANKAVNDAIEETYDVVVVGAGGAGMAAAAQATQNGNTVLIIEKNAEIGGNTLVSGGSSSL